VRWQDAIEYVRRRDAVDFVEACRRLGQVRVATAAAWCPRLAEPATTRDTPPSALWQAAGWTLVAEAERVLWSDAGRAARIYLARRGLTEATVTCGSSSMGRAGRTACAVSPVL
jgi:hypothetical protein